MSEEVTVGLQFTRNLGNFENVRVHVERTSSVANGEVFEDAAKRVYESVDNFLSEKIREIDADAATRK